MVDSRLGQEDRSFTSDGTPVRFFSTPLLRENLDDLTLALGLGRPVFLLGPAGSGKSMLSDQVALQLAPRYGVARVAGRAGLELDDVVEACRRGFAPDAWTDLMAPAGEKHEPARPGGNIVIVDDAETIEHRFIEQMVALSNGSSDLLPSHRLLFVGRETLADLIEAGRVRNHWGAPVIVEIEPWRGDTVAPFLRQRLQSAGCGDPEQLSEAAIRRIAMEAGGNPGRMLDLARRALQPADTPEWIAPPAERPSPPANPRPTTIINLAQVKARAEAPGTVLFAEPIAAVPAFRRTAEEFERAPLVDLERILKLGLPVYVAVAAGFLFWELTGPSPWPVQPSPPRPAIADLPPAAAPVAVSAALVVPAPAPPRLPSPEATAAVIVAPPTAEISPAASGTGAVASSVAEPAAPAALPPAEPIVATPAPAPAVHAPVVAPAASTAALAEATPPPAIPVDALIARGDLLLNNGDFAAARLFYLQAVRAGSARAATAVARTYDPLALDRLGVVGGRGEQTKAIEWYRKAVDLGDPDAAEPLRRLAPP